MSNEFIGQDFGFLTVLKEYSVRNKRNKVERYFDCICKCGKEKSIRKMPIILGKTRSCGCLKSSRPYPIKTGDKFGYLTLIEDTKIVKSERIAKCICVCGVIKDYYINNIKNKKNCSCGCYNRQRLKDSPISTRKITDQEQIKNICEVYSSGGSTKILASKYNVSDDTIYSLLRLNDISIRSNTDKCLLYETFINRERFTDYNCPETAYYYGFLLADGNINKNRVSLKLKSTDGYLLEKFHAWLNCTTKIHSRETFDKRTGKFNYSTTVTFADKVVADNLRLLGMTERKSKEEKLPLVYQFNRHFWRGMIDGDGHISDKNTTVGLCGSLEIIEGFVAYIKTLIDVPLPKIQNANGLYKISLGKRIVCKTLLDELYRESTVHLERKHSNYLTKYCKTEQA